MVGVDVEDARRRSRAAARGRPQSGRGAGSCAAAGDRAGRPSAPPLPDLRDPRFSLERETLKLVVQHPEVVGHAAHVDGDDFTHPPLPCDLGRVAACGGPTAAPATEVWVSKLRDNVEDGPSPTRSARSPSSRCCRPRRPTGRYVNAHVYRLQELTAMRRIADLKSAAAHQPGRARHPSTTGCSARRSRSSSTGAPCARRRSAARLMR